MLQSVLVILWSFILLKVFSVVGGRLFLLVGGGHAGWPRDREASSLLSFLVTVSPKTISPQNKNPRNRPSAVTVTFGISLQYICARWNRFSFETPGSPGREHQIEAQYLWLDLSMAARKKISSVNILHRSWACALAERGGGEEEEWCGGADQSATVTSPPGCRGAEGLYQSEPAHLWHAVNRQAAPPARM